MKTNCLSLVCAVIMAVAATSGYAKILITEIMYDPVSSQSVTSSEYVEIVNVGNTAISVSDWKILDATGKVQATIPSNASPLKPFQYLIVASGQSVYDRFEFLKDSANVIIVGSSSLGLNSTEDQVVIRDSLGMTIDSVSYSNHWHRKDVTDTKGVSLERISVSGSSNDPQNWSSSAALLGGTPCTVNSIAIAPEVTSVTLHVSPGIISPDGDGRDDFARISYNLPSTTARITVTVYNRNGYEQCRLLNNKLSPAKGEILWNGCDEHGVGLRVGIYIVRLEAYDEGGSGLVSAQYPIVVARAL